MTGGRDPAEIARWTLTHLACLASKDEPGSTPALESEAEAFAVMEAIEREERDWYAS